MTFVYYRAVQRGVTALLVVGTLVGTCRLVAYVVDRAVIRSLRRRHSDRDADW